MLNSGPNQVLVHVSKITFSFKFWEMSLYKFCTRVFPDIQNVWVYLIKYITELFFTTGFCMFPERGMDLKNVDKHGQPRRSQGGSWELKYKLNTGKIIKEQIKGRGSFQWNRYTNPLLTIHPCSRSGKRATTSSLIEGSIGLGLLQHHASWSHQMTLL